MKQPKKGRLWLNDGSRVRLRPEYRNHVWSYDFVRKRCLRPTRDQLDVVKFQGSSSSILLAG